MNKTVSPKFDFLDGLRGICALYVAFYHAQLFTGNTGIQFSSYIKPLSIFLSFGQFSVPVFIVLSGFCLTIPVASSENTELRGGFKRYISRRFKRIVPPYYVALIIFLLLIFAVPVLQVPHNTAWDTKIPLEWQSISSHFLLIHNLRAGWIYKIDGPMWSVATEWQIYFFFPVLIYIWRRFGLAWSVSVSVITGFLIAFVLPLPHFWYLGLFGLGMGASAICFSADGYLSGVRSTVNWKVLSIIASIVMVVFLLADHFKNFRYSISETIVGFCICIILINYTLIEMNGQKRNVFLSFYNSRFAIFAGVFSYSIYLIHSPIIGLLNLLTINFKMCADVRLFMVILVFTPIAVGFAYLFHLAFERRFMPGHLKRQESKML